MATKFFISVITIFTAIDAPWGAGVDLGLSPYFRNDYQFEPRQAAFYKIHRLGKTWTQALTTCQGEGARLAVPESSAEVDTILKLMKEQMPNKRGAFVGIHDMFGEDTFVTIDGRDISEVWSEWKSGEPSDSNANEDCVMLLSEGKYNDENCNSRQPFICKKTLASLTSNPVCETADSAYFPDKNKHKCYKLHVQARNWSDAYSICHAEQSYLTIINSESEARLLEDLFAKYPKDRLKGQVYKDGIFLGFHDRFNEGEHITVKGKPLSESGYTNWGNDQPDDYGGNEDCGSMYRDGRLNDISCSTRALFVCERDLGFAKSVDIYARSGRLSSDASRTRVINKGVEPFNRARALGLTAFGLGLSWYVATWPPGEATVAASASIADTTVIDEDMAARLDTFGTSRRLAKPAIRLVFGSGVFSAAITALTSMLFMVAVMFERYPWRMLALPALLVLGMEAAADAADAIVCAVASGRASVAVLPAAVAVVSLEIAAWLVVLDFYRRYQREEDLNEESWDFFNRQDLKE